MRRSRLSALALALTTLSACGDADPASPPAPAFDRIEAPRLAGSVYRVDRFSTPMHWSEFGIIDEQQVIHKRQYVGHVAAIGSDAEARKVGRLLQEEERCWVTADGQYVVLSADGDLAAWDGPASCVVIELEPVPNH